MECGSFLWFPLVSDVSLNDFLSNPREVTLRVVCEKKVWFTDVCQRVEERQGQ